MYSQFMMHGQENIKLSFCYLIGAIPLSYSINKNVVQSKHNNIFNNVKFATCFSYK